MFRKLISMAAAVVVVAPALSAEWMTDWEAAKAQAAAEGKAVLVNFTGSDWCVPCSRLHQLVLDTPDFEAYAKDRFVLMEVDMPRKHPQPETLAQQNGRLCRQFRITGFPTVVVVNPQGRIIGGFAGALLDIPSVFSRLDAALENRGLLEKAGKMQGSGRARILYDVYLRLPESFRAPSGLAEEVLAADPDNVTGFRTAQSVELQWEEIRSRIDDAGTDSQKLRAIVVSAMETALPPNKAKLEEMLAQMEFSEIYREVSYMGDDYQAAIAFLADKAKVVPESILGDVLTLKAELQIQAAETVEDILAAKACMEQAFRVAPPHSPQFREYFERNFADPAAFLEKVKRQRKR